MQRIFLISLMMLFVVCLLYPSHNKLITPVTPKGILELELAFHNDRAVSIREYWENAQTASISGYGDPNEKWTLAEYARLNICLDFLFILIYCLWLTSLNSYVNTAKPLRKKWINILILLVSGLDIIENIGMLIFLQKKNSYPVLGFSAPASIKWVFIVCIALSFLSKERLAEFFRYFTRLLRDTASIVRYLPLSIISVLLLFFTFWVSDQGQDLLLVVNDYAIAPVFLYLVLVILAVMNWHFPKFYYGVNWSELELKCLFTRPFNFTPNTPVNTIAIPRLMGVLTILVPAFGILHTLSVFKVNYVLSSFSPMLLLLLTTLAIQYCFQYDIFRDFFKKYGTGYITCCILFFLSPVLFMAFNQQRAFDIQWLFYGLLCYAVLFAMFTANRCDIAQKYPWLMRIKITPIIWLSTLAPIAIFLAFVVGNYRIRPLGIGYLAIAVVFGGIIFYYVIFAILNVLGRKFRINFSLFLILLLMVLAARSNNFHVVKPIAVNNIHQLTLREYTTKWLTDRVAHIPANDTVYRIYLINAYGGGIRASAWTCLAISKLDSMQDSKYHDKFQDHVFAYSGASGGTIGSSVLCANRYIHKDYGDSMYRSFYKRDFLTPVLAGLVGNDIWSASIPCTLRDRSDVQEHLWEKYYEESFDKNAYALPVERIWNRENLYVPLLFSNTTDVRNGGKGIYAPVKLDSIDFPGTTAVNNILPPNTGLKLSTAAFLSARFPFISPAGRFRKDGTEYDFLDGGIVENSGAETSAQIYRVLREVIHARPDRSKFKVYFVSLKNTYKSDDSVLAEKSKGISQLIAPVTGAVNVGVGGNTRKAEWINKTYRDTLDSLYGGYYIVEPRIELVRSPVKYLFIWSTTLTAQVPLPLGWSISSSALDRLSGSLTNNSELKKIMNPAK